MFKLDASMPKTSSSRGSKRCKEVQFYSVHTYLSLIGNNTLQNHSGLSFINFNKSSFKDLVLPLRAVHVGFILGH